jgi:hypothetical protein
VEAGIILEDDCLPNQDFFVFCQYLLRYYENNEKIMHISGDNFLKNGKHPTSNASYFFGRLPHIWGWATWKRAWKLYDVDVKSITKYIDGERFPFRNKLEKASFWSLFLEVGQDNKDTWDYQWLYSILEKDGLCIHPAVNLVSNIGFGADGTHGLQQDHILANLPTFELTLPYQHPKEVRIDTGADDQVIRSLFYKSGFDNFKFRLKTKLKKLIS